MARRFGAAWWSLILPAGWQGQHDEECSTITGPRHSGALQISAYQKERANVTDGDLREFALEQRGSSAPLRRYRFGAFEGFGVTWQSNGTCWREWWLRTGSVMLYVTFNDENRVRLDALRPILDSLSQRAAASPNHTGPGRPRREAPSRARRQASRRSR